MFVKDSKCFSEYLRTVHIGKDEELVSFNVSALFTSILVPTALDVINQLFIKHVEVPEARGKYGYSFEQNTIGLTKDEVMKLLKLVLEKLCLLLSKGTSLNNYMVQLWVLLVLQWWPISTWSTFKDMALGSELPLLIKEWKRYVDDVFSIIPKGQRDTMLNYLNSIDPHIKFTVEQPNEEGAIPFLDTLPKPKGEEISVLSLQETHTHPDRYLDFNSSHPISAKRAVLRALMDRAENVCSDPEILAEEVEHLSKVLCYNNYPQWMIDKWGKSDKVGPLIHPDTGHEIRKQFYVSVPYFPGLSEAFKKIFKYTAVQVCFKGVNTLKSHLMHPKDKVPTSQKKDIVYHWELSGRWLELLIYWRNFKIPRGKSQRTLQIEHICHCIAQIFTTPCPQLKISALLTRTPLK